MATLLRHLITKNLSNQIIRNASKCVKKDSFIILRATSEDFDSILKLMKRAYYPEEPTCSALAFKPNTVFEDATIQSLCEGYSLIAKCKYNGDILGACVNETTNPWDPDLKDKQACNVACVKTRQLLHFYAYIQRAPDLWRQYGAQKVFEMSQLFVRKDQRRKGLALRLMEESRNLAADCGFHLVRVDGTSFFTSQLCEKMKMKLVKEIPYCSYVGEDKKPIFQPPDPHKSVKIYVDDDPQLHALSSEECKNRNKKK